MRFAITRSAWMVAASAAPTQVKLVWIKLVVLFEMSATDGVRDEAVSHSYCMSSTARTSWKSGIS